MDHDSYNTVYGAVKAARKQGGFIYACSFFIALIMTWFGLLSAAGMSLLVYGYKIATLLLRVVYDFLNMTFVVIITYVRVYREKDSENETTSG